MLVALVLARAMQLSACSGRFDVGQLLQPQTLEFPPLSNCHDPSYGDLVVAARALRGGRGSASDQILSFKRNSVDQNGSR
jgi:hypothetical protein